MASKAAVYKNNERRRKVAVHKARRDELREIMKDPKVDPE